MLPNPTLFDRYGFLIDAGDWNQTLAAQITFELGIGRLQAPHLAIIHALRQHHAESQAIPPTGHICRELGMSEDCIDSFFRGPLNAWKAAGLPNPGEEARVYLDNQTRDT